jgi:hypothetical protein
VHPDTYSNARNHGCRSDGDRRRIRIIMRGRISRWRAVGITRWGISIIRIGRIIRRIGVIGRHTHYAPAEIHAAARHRLRA